MEVEHFSMTDQPEIDESCLATQSMRQEVSILYRNKGTLKGRKSLRSKRSSSSEIKIETEATIGRPVKEQIKQGALMAEHV